MVIVLWRCVGVKKNWVEYVDFVKTVSTVVDG